MHWDRVVLGGLPDSARPSARSHWERYRDHSPELVNDHDFRSDAEGLAIPYGIYDTRANAGTVFVGQTADTPAFAVDCIEKWWRTEGCKHYPDANALQILADGGGSNSCTARAWKFNLQHRLANRHGLRVSVAHYPPATSKWNPIEHRLFCEVTKNWAGRPPDSYETILNYLRTHRHRTARPRAPGPQDLQDRRQGHRAQMHASHPTAPCPNGTTPSNPCDEKTEFILAPGLRPRSVNFPPRPARTVGLETHRQRLMQRSSRFGVPPAREAICGDSTGTRSTRDASGVYQACTPDSSLPKWNYTIEPM